MKIIAHRCGTDKYPMLTVAAAEYSLALGADYVEFDIRFTNDNCPVINHDEDCTALFGNDKMVCELSAVKFLSLRHKNCAFSSHTLRHFLECGVKKILFHIKEGGERLNIVLDLCREYGVENDVIFGVQTIDDLLIVKKYNEAIKILAFMPSCGDIALYADAGADIIRLWEAWATDENINNVKRLNMEVWVMTGCVDGYERGYTDKLNIIKWADTGVDGILVNEIGKTIDILSYSQIS